MLASAPQSSESSWVGTWEAAPAWADPAVSFADVTLREVVHVSVGGEKIRVRFSNAFGTAPLTIGHATIALRSSGAAAETTPIRLTFGGDGAIAIPPEAQVLSDPVTLHVPPRSDLLISLFLPLASGPATVHPLAIQTNYSASGDRTSDRRANAFKPIATSWYFLSGVDVSDSQKRGAVVAFGDSITDGWHSRLNENGRWPDVLARRLLALRSARELGVLNAGISGNRILLDRSAYGQNALARFDRDVLGQVGVRDVIVLLGINDIQQQPQQNDARRIDSGLLQIATRAHVHGLRVFACTLTPVEGDYAYSQRGEATRESVNTFVRTSRAFDGIFDFDKALRDPSDPHRLLPAYDSGDHLHPNAAGQRAMGAAIDLNAL
jgi:lysophospholipase L1-like esterase